MFKKNIVSLEKVNPSLANRLKSIKNEKFEIYVGEDRANLNFIDKKHFKPIYDKPLKETMKKLEEFKKFMNYPILYFYGVGNGIFYKLLLESHPKLEKIIIYEPDLEILYLALNFVDFSDVMEKIEFVYTKEYSLAYAFHIFEDWQFRFFLKTYNLHIHSKYYSDIYAEDIIKVNKINTEAIKQIVLSHGNDANDSIIGLKHTLHNLPEQLSNYRIADLVKNRLNSTAIIVSTGPSLTKQLPLLKEIQDKATIIAVDASLPILGKEGIKPDFVTTIERVELTSQFFKHTSKEFMKDIYFVIASLTHPETLKAITGKKIIVHRPFLYTRYIGPDEFGYIGVGMSAANMAFELAYHLGHHTTILIGQDLAYGDGVSHAKGHILGEDEVKYRDDDLYVEAYGGKGKVRTQKFWNIFRGTFEKAIADTKDKMLTINATEGGARIHGALEIPFKEVVKNLKENKNKIELTKPTKEETIFYLKEIIEKIEKALEVGTSTQKKFEKVFLKVAEAWDELVFLNKTNQLEKIDFEKLTNISDEIDEVKELLNNEEFQKFYLDILQPFLINAELDLGTVIVKSANNEIEKQAKIIDWVMKHREWLFTVAGTIDTQRKVTEEELKNLKNYLKSIK